MIRCLARHAHLLELLAAGLASGDRSHQSAEVEESLAWVAYVPALQVTRIATAGAADERAAGAAGGALPRVTAS